MVAEYVTYTYLGMQCPKHVHADRLYPHDGGHSEKVDSLYIERDTKHFLKLNLLVNVQLLSLKSADTLPSTATAAGPRIPRSPPLELWKAGLLVAILVLVPTQEKNKHSVRTATKG